MQKNKIRLFVYTLLLLFITNVQLHAQNGTNSPYSRFGFGEMYIPSFHTYNNSMGGLSQTIRNNNILNPQNPASFTAIQPGTFVFDIGFSGEVSRLQTKTDKNSWEGSSSLSHILFGFPIIDQYKMSLGLMPYSKINFSSSFTQNDPYAGKYTQTHKGFGGINQLYWGHAFQFFNQLSIGFNASYLFGKVSHASSLTFLDSIYYMDSWYEENVQLSNFTGSIGIQYRLPVNENHGFIFGATYAIPAKFNVTNQSVIYSAKNGVIYDNNKDSSSTNEIRLPQSIGAGVSFQKNDKWMVGVDMTFTSWSKHLYLDESPSNKTDNFNISIGGEKKGDLSAMKYRNRISLRTGVHYESAAYTIDQNKIDDLGVHFGLSFPMKKSRSVINLSFMYGVLGTTQNDLIKKDYYKIGVSLSAGDRWFIKRKYD